MNHLLQKNSVMNRLLIFFGCVVLIISCSKCKEKECTDPTNPDCPNYNRCWNKEPLSAEFRIFSTGAHDNEGNSKTSEVLSGDTAWCKATMLFKLNNPSGVDSVKWQVGNDLTVYEELNHNVLFNLPYSNVPITCIVYGPQDEECFGTAYTSDTVVKYLTVVQWPDLPIWSYKFRCHYNTDPLEEFDIYFEIEVDPNSPPGLPLGDQELYGLAHLGECTITGIDGYNHAFVNLSGTGLPACEYEPEYYPYGICNISPDKMTISGPITIDGSVTISGYRID